jgi:hypothetical protein
MEKIVTKFRKLFIGKIHYITILLLLFLAGLFSYYILKHEFDTKLWLIDSDFKQYVIIFIVTSLATIFGVESVLQFQKDRAVVNTLKILNYGYDIHELMARTLNFMSEFQVIEYSKVDPIFHNYYKTRKDQVTNSKEAYLRFNSILKTHIDFIENNDPVLEKIVDAKLSIEKVQLHREEIEKIYTRMIAKFNLSLKVDSQVLFDLTLVIQIVENYLWYLQRYIDDQTVLNKKKRVFVGSYRLLNVLLNLLKNKKLFFISEIDFDKTFLGENSYKIDKILSE